MDVCGPEDRGCSFCCPSAQGAKGKALSGLRRGKVLSAPGGELVRTRILALLFLGGFFLCLPLAAQAPSPAAEPTAVIHATTREVLLDFVARDRHHHAITDLRPEEVEVYEDGVLQKVNSFRNI